MTRGSRLVSDQHPAPDDHAAPPSTRSRLGLLGLLGLLVGLVLACGGGNGVANGPAVPMPPVQKARWDCPTPVQVTPTALEADPNPLVPTVVFSATAPTATPYYRGDYFYLGQDVYAGTMRVTVHSIRSLGPADPALGGGVMQQLDLEVESASASPLDLAAQVVLREVQAPDGTGIRGWWRSDSRTQATADPWPTSLAAGVAWRGMVMIRTPHGTPTRVQVYQNPAVAYLTDGVTDGMIVVHGYADPWCTDNIARRPSAPDPMGTPGVPIGTPGFIPPGSNAVAAWAYAHVGYPYVWGAKGPNAFDCSGLVYSAYASVGVALPVGTTAPNGGQWATGIPIALSDLQPGDAMFFHTYAPSPPPSHVGIYVGDMDGDGRGDMVSGNSPQLGVQFESNVRGSSYWMSHFMGARRYPTPAGMTLVGSPRQNQAGFGWY